MLSMKNTFMILLAGLFAAALFLTFSGGNSYGDDNAPVFSCGQGPYELIIFSDYFCPSCQKIHKEFAGKIPELIDKGVRVSFVDIPVYKLTPLYAKYFLFALNASPDCREALMARNFLCDKADRLGAITAEQLERDMKTEGIPFTPYDIRPSLDRYDVLIGKYEVHSTPTFVFIYSPKDIRIYTGSEKIRKGMAELLNALEAKSPRNKISK